MSLRSEISELAASMAKAAADNAGDANGLMGSLMMFAAELKGLARGIPDGPQQHDGPAVPPVSVAAELMRNRLQASQSRQQEAGAAIMRMCVGGPADDTHVACHPDMPVGAKASVAGCVYALGDDGCLHVLAAPSKR